MPIDGSIGADFSDFDRAAKQSTQALDDFATMALSVSARSTNAFTSMSQGIMQIDRMAALAGVHLGPLGGALGELGAIVQSTATAFGVLGPAAIAAGAAMATLKVGELVRDYTSLDETLTDVIYSMTGWTKGSREGWAAQQELARATEWSGVKITDLTVALQVNAEATRIAAMQAADLAQYEERAADQAEELGRRFVERFKERTAATNEAVRQANETQRTFTNFINERLIEDQARALAAEEANERAFRQTQNWLGEQYLKAEGERIKQLEEERINALEAAAKAEAEFFQKDLHGGVLVTGMTPSSLERPQSLSQSGVVAFGPAQEGQFTWPGPSVPFPATGTGTTVNNITMSGMLMSTDPSALDSLRQTINRALGPTLRHQYHPSS